MNIFGVVLIAHGGVRAQEFVQHVQDLAAVDHARIVRHLGLSHSKNSAFERTWQHGHQSNGQVSVRCDKLLSAFFAASQWMHCPTAPLGANERLLGQLGLHRSELQRRGRASIVGDRWS